MAQQQVKFVDQFGNHVAPPTVQSPIQQPTIQYVDQNGNLVTPPQPPQNQIKYVDQNGNPVAPPISQFPIQQPTVKYVDQNGNPVSTPISPIIKYVNQNGNPVSAPSSPSIKYVDQFGNPITTPQPQPISLQNPIKYVDQNGNPVAPPQPLQPQIKYIDQYGNPVAAPSAQQITKQQSIKEKKRIEKEEQRKKELEPKFIELTVKIPSKSPKSNDEENKQDDKDDNEGDDNDEENDKKDVPKLSEFDFSKLAPNRVSCGEHCVLFLSTMPLWMVITSVLALLFSQDHDAFILIGNSVAFASLVLIFCNPIYFSSFRYKYQPKGIKTIYIEQDNDDEEEEKKNDINPSLQINTTHSAASIDIVYNKDDNVNDIGIQTTNIQQTNSGKTIKTQTKEDKPDKEDEEEKKHNDPSKASCKNVCWRISKRIFFMVIMTVILFVGLAAGETDGSDPKRQFFCIVMAIGILAADLKLCCHMIIYYPKKYWLYNFIFWALWSIINAFSWNKGNSRWIFLGVSLVLFLLQALCATYGSSFYKKTILHQIDPNEYEHPWIGFKMEFATDEAKAKKEQEEAEKDPIKKNKIRRTIYCCCGKIILDFKSCVRVQISVSAVAFWTYFTFRYLLPRLYCVFPISAFLMCTLIWNPIFYTKKLEAVNNKKMCISLKTAIKEKRLCFSWSKICYYCFWVPLTIFGGGVTVVVLLIISLSLISDPENAESSRMDDVFEGTAIAAAILLYLPATGFTFYILPVHYALSHMVSALFCFLVPIAILADSIREDGDLFAEFNHEGDGIILMVFSSVILVTFLSISGASCSCYRFQKSLTETQAYLTTSTGFSKGIDTKEVPLTLMRVSTFVLTTVDFITDSVWTFKSDTFTGSYKQFRYVAIFLWMIQVIVLLISTCSSIEVIKRRLKFKKHTTTRMGYIRYKCWTEHRVLCCLCCLFYPLFWIGYMIFMIILSALLSVTKLLAIKQVREWWLSLIVSEYKETVATQLSIQSQTSLQSISGNIDHDIDIVQNKDSKDNNNDDKIIDEMMGKNDNEKDVRGEYGKIWAAYYWIEDQSPDWLTKFKINASVYNNYLISELVVESIPLLILNIVNGYSTQWNVISYISAMSSALFILYGLLKFAYYVGCKNYDLAKFVL